MKILKTISWVILFILLTIVTQIGGIAFVISSLINRYWKIKFNLKPVVLFLSIYLLITFLVTPVIAPLFGREKVKHSEIIQPGMYLTVILNRNYVVPEVNEVLKKTEQHLRGTDVKINYLDANFPFINKFPLLPHLSHYDGKKIDFALVYQYNKGEISHKLKSVSGYGVFEKPKSSETNQIGKCLSSGYLQYNFPKYFTLGKINSELIFSEKGTFKLINSLLTNEEIRKIFIEPHLKQRLKLVDKRVRYHGCRSVRHDDHIHVQIR